MTTAKCRLLQDRKTIHCEVEGAIVNIRENLHALDGKAVTSVEIIPNRYEGDSWDVVGPDDKVLERGINIRVRRRNP